MSDIRLESDSAVRHLVLDAPERLNALDHGMLVELAAAVATVQGDTAARVLVVRAEGKAFCSGADLRSLFGDTTRPPSVIRDDLKSVYASFLGLRDLTIPTIAAVDGIAVGAGVNIALACDVVVAGPRARFGITFADIGLHPGGGCTWFLTQGMGAKRAMATLLGGETIDAQSAYETGLVSVLAEDAGTEALRLAAVYASRDPQLVADIKRAVQVATEADLAAVLELESWAQASSVTKPAFAEFLASRER